MWRGIAYVSLYCTFYESGKGTENMETSVPNYEEPLPIFRRRERERESEREKGGLSWGRWTLLPRLVLFRKQKAVFRWGGPQSKQIRPQLQSKVKAFNTGGALCKLHPDTEPRPAQPSLLLIITANLRTRAVRWMPHTTGIFWTHRLYCNTVSMARSLRDHV